MKEKRKKDRKREPRARIQYGALPYRLNAESGLQLLLVTTRETGRWIIPKGWPQKGKAPHRSAAQEAFEESGVLGDIRQRPLGSYSYPKRMKGGGLVTCDVEVFALKVLRERKNWPEKGQRNIQWCAPDQALGMIEEEGLKELVSGFADRFAKAARHSGKAA